MTRSQATDLRSLKLHVHRGLVWFIDRDGHPQSSGKSVEDFLEGALWRDTACVRMIGNKANAALLVALYDKKMRNLLESVQVVSPLVCPTANDRRSPEASLYHMRRWLAAPVQGGFHELTPLDFPTYALAAELQGWVAGQIPDKAMQFLQAHPVWRSLSFIRHLDPTNVALLLAEILDPRWYFDVRNPDRGSKLEAYMGLSPKTQHSVTLGGPPGRHHKRCRLVRDCWHSPSMARQAYEMLRQYGVEPPFDGEVVSQSPGDFLWRVWGRRVMGPGDAQELVVRGELRASQKFLAFLRLVWLARLYEGAVWSPDGGASLFRARDFFRYLVEAEAYDRYMQ